VLIESAIRGHFRMAAHRQFMSSRKQPCFILQLAHSRLHRRTIIDINYNYRCNQRLLNRRAHRRCNLQLSFSRKILSSLILSSCSMLISRCFLFRYRGIKISDAQRAREIRKHIVQIFCRRKNMFCVTMAEFSNKYLR